MKFYQILFLLGFLAPAALGLSFHGLARRHKNRETKLFNDIQAKLAKKHKKNRKNGQKQVLTAFELNHQECDIVRVSRDSDFYKISKGHQHRLHC